MKGIMILGFNERFEAYIVAQYPSDISKNLNIKASDLMNIYTLHKMKKSEPNFFQMEIKDFSVASFFTGSSFKHYVGTPDYAITVFLSEDEINEDILPKDFEFLLRRIANEILPKKNDVDDSVFFDLLKKYYVMLKNGELEPYWEESTEEEIEASTTQTDIIEDFNKQEINEEEISEDIDNKTEVSEESGSKLEAEVIVKSEEKKSNDHYDKLEKQVLEEEIEDLKSLLNEKTEKIRELTKRITEIHSDKSDLEEGKLKYDEFKEKSEVLEDNVNKLTEITSQQNEEMENQARKINELKKELEKKQANIDELNKKLLDNERELAQSKTIQEETEKYQKEIDKLKKDNDTHLDSIASLKLRLKQLKNKISDEAKIQDKLTEDIIDLKKELKVLRRERNHYLEIIKKNNLL